MLCESDSVFSLAQMQRLLAEEWAVARQRSVEVAAGAALSFAPEAAFARLELTAHPNLTQLHLSGDRFEGDAQCAPTQLPWDNDSVQLVIVRHVIDCLGADSGFEAEIARILAPGGRLFVFGFNALSPWRIWCGRQRRLGKTVPRCSSASHLRRTLEAFDITSTIGDSVGGAWPTHSTAVPAARANPRGARWRAAWLLAAQKQRIPLRPIAINQSRARVVLGPTLAHTSSRPAKA